MKKMYAMKERAFCVYLIILFSALDVILFVNNNDSTILVFAFYMCLAFIVLAFLKIFFIPCHIIFSNNNIKVFDFPFGATNRYYHKKRNLIEWNSNIHISEVETIELIKLTKEEQRSYIGYKHLFNKYLKISLKSGKSKYINVRYYSKAQIEKIIKTIQKGKICLEI